MFSIKSNFSQINWGSQNLTNLITSGMIETWNKSEEMLIRGLRVKMDNVVEASGILLKIHVKFR